MGFLGLGAPLPWKESREVIAYVRRHGIAQFIALYNKVKNIENDELLWGDELEYGIFVVDEEAGTVKLSLRSAEILQTLQGRENPSDLETGCSWVPEYGSWMVEGTPSKPYSGFADDLIQVETNMRKRRARLLAALQPGEICPTVPGFPLLGVGDFTQVSQPKRLPTHSTRCCVASPHARRALSAQEMAMGCACCVAQPSVSAGGPIAESLFVPDAIINPHPRFGALTQNIRTRRGEKVDIRMPRFRDTKTPRCFTRLLLASVCDPSPSSSPSKQGESHAEPQAHRASCSSSTCARSLCPQGDASRWASSGRPEVGARDGRGLHGRDGVWHGVLLPAGHFPGA
jgi:glutamate--cysteine ligase catalytic subunit